jgi:crotonobetainyl-CoA:carnitine CoA-transferase CaiB-like acyl-CoA transferase
MEVVKVEPLAGDPVRRLGPFAQDEPHAEGSLRFAYLNAGKRSVALDLEQPDDRERLLGLVERADVLLESWDPGTLEGLGLGVATLHQRNPRLTVTSVSGFGQEGPYRDYRCTDLVGLAMGGLLYLSGDPSLPPVKAPETQAYYFASVYAAFGTLLALHRRAADDEGRQVDISVQETITVQEGMVRTHGFEGASITRLGSQHPSVCPATIFPTRDGYVYLFVSRPHWRLILDLWKDHPAELDDAKWLPNHVRRAATDWVTEHFRAFTRQYDSAELVDLLQRHGVPCLPVNTPTQFMLDEQVRSRELFQTTSHPRLGEYAQVGFPLLVNGVRPLVAPPPLLGADTGTLLEAPAGGTAAHASGSTAAARNRGASGPAGGAGRGRRDVGAGLKGVRVLSFTTGIAGPHAALALARCGAEVIKIESRHGGIDSFRFFASDDDLNSSPRFVESNLNVLSAQLNLKNPEGVRLLKELVAHCDVVMDNFRPDVLPRMGLGPDELRQVREDLIVLRLPGLGCAGPKYGYGTWGSTLTAFSGMTYLWNQPGQPEPIGFQGVYPDYVVAGLAPTVVLAALLHRQRTGEGLTLELAQVEATAHLLGVSFLETVVNGHEPVPVGNDWPYAAPHNVYPCRGEDRWCAIAVETDAQWRALCQVIGAPALADDARYATLAARRQHLVTLDALLAEWTRDRDAHSVMQALQAVGVPCGAVQSGADLFADPQLALRGSIVAIEHPTLGHLPMADVPLRFSDRGLDPPRDAAKLGEHNEHVFCTILGHSAAELAAWQAAGVVA